MRSTEANFTNEWPEFHLLRLCECIEHTSWRLDNAPWEPALAWVPNYVSVGEHKDFVKAKFEEDVAEGLMDRMTLGEFKAKFGEHRAIASLAVIVEDEEKDKKRIIHDATHGVRVNHRIKCRDKIRAPGPREKIVRCGEIAGRGGYLQGPPEIQTPGVRAWLHGVPDRHGGDDSWRSGKPDRLREQGGHLWAIARRRLVDPHSRMWDTGYPSPVGSRLPHRPPSVCRRPRGPEDRVRGEERNSFAGYPFKWAKTRRLGVAIGGGVAGDGDGVLLLQARYVQKAG